MYQQLVYSQNNQQMQQMAVPSYNYNTYYQPVMAQVPYNQPQVQWRPQVQQYQILQPVNPIQQPVQAIQIIPVNPYQGEITRLTEENSRLSMTIAENQHMVENVKNRIKFLQVPISLFALTIWRKPDRKPKHTRTSTKWSSMTTPRWMTPKTWGKMTSCSSRRGPLALCFGSRGMWRRKTGDSPVKSTNASRYPFTPSQTLPHASLTFPPSSVPTTSVTGATGRTSVWTAISNETTEAATRATESSSQYSFHFPPLLTRPMGK